MSCVSVSFATARSKISCYQLFSTSYSRLLQSLLRVTWLVCCCDVLFWESTCVEPSQWGPTTPPQQCKSLVVCKHTAVIVIYISYFGLLLTFSPLYGFVLGNRCSVTDVETAAWRKTKQLLLVSFIYRSRNTAKCSHATMYCELELQMYL